MAKKTKRGPKNKPRNPTYKVDGSHLGELVLLEYRARYMAAALRGVAESLEKTQKWIATIRENIKKNAPH